MRIMRLHLVLRHLLVHHFDEDTTEECASAADGVDTRTLNNCIHKLHMIMACMDILPWQSKLE